ncbi:hypothetical protein CspHIS471_0107010 [Cutaneotrichosporon sp. HIS471]|nr:hypothetical protein CspHIS471_0107010 [Cutaneotrichosporon sp. HIS471]
MDPSLAASPQDGHFFACVSDPRIHTEQKEWPQAMLTGPCNNSLQIGHNIARSSRTRAGKERGKGLGSSPP